MTKKHTIILGITFIISLFSCKKMDYDSGFTTLGEVYFDASNVAINKTGEGRVLQIRTNNGYPVEWNQEGKLTSPEGERTFQFYDKRTGEILAEKAVNVVAGSPEKWTLFQPQVGQPISIISPTENAEEPPAKDGFMKLKIANLATNSLPYDQIDVVVYGPGDVVLGTIEGVGKTFNESEFQEITRGENQFYFSFINSANKEPIKNGSGQVFKTNLTPGPGTINPMTGLNGPKPTNWVFTTYILDGDEWDSSLSSFVIQGANDKWYTPSINHVLFHN